MRTHLLEVPLSDEAMAKRQRWARVATDLAVVILLFSTLMGAWIGMVLSGLALTGLLLYVWFVLRDPDRQKYILLAGAAALASGAVSTALALWR